MLGGAAWTPLFSAAGEHVKFQVAGLRSNQWPGAFCACQGSRFSNVYVGWGVKAGAFVPLPPPPVRGLGFGFWPPGLREGGTAWHPMSHRCARPQLQLACTPACACPSGHPAGKHPPPLPAPPPGPQVSKEYDAALVESRELPRKPVPAGEGDAAAEE